MGITPTDNWDEWKDATDVLYGTYGLIIMLFALTVVKAEKADVVSQIAYYIVAFCAFKFTNLALFMFGWLLLALILNCKEIFLGSQRMKLIHVMGAFGIYIFILYSCIWTTY